MELRAKHLWSVLGRIIICLMISSSCIFLPEETTKKIDDHFHPGMEVIINPHLPVAVADAITIDFETAKTFTVLDNDTDDDGDSINVTGVTSVSHGTLTNNGDNTLSYTPAADFSGTDTFTYTIQDSRGGSASALVTLTVKTYCNTFTQQAAIPFTGGANPYSPLPDGTSTKPYRVCTKAQMDTTSGNVALWDTEYYKVYQNIDMDNGGANNGIIGTNVNQFTGSFDGNNFTLSNFRYIDNLSDYIALFAYVGAAGVVKNLTVDTGLYRVEGKSYVGAIIGRSDNSQSNLSAKGVVVGSGVNSQYIGGAIGYMVGNLSDSISTASVANLVNRNTGGLVGYIQGSIDNASVTVNVTHNGAEFSGGVAGQVTSGSITNTYAQGAMFISPTGANFLHGGIVGNLNNGNLSNSWSSISITSVGASTVGGLVGGLATANTISNASSSSTIITDNTTTGGIAGRAMAGTIQNSFFTGSIVSSSSGAGGITGENRGTIQNCYLKGSVSGASRSGGISGTQSGTGIILNSYNTEGTVTGGTEIGGLVGQFYGSMESSYNTRDVSCTSNYCGGLIGQALGGVVTKSFNLGNITTPLTSGSGISGLSSNANINNSWNLGSVKSSGAVSGIASTTSAANSVAYNLSLGDLYSNGPFNGGVVASSASTSSITNNRFLGSLTCTSSRCGGILGYSTGAGTIEGSLYDGNIHGAAQSGGIVGQGTAANQILNCMSKGKISGSSTVAGIASEWTGDITQSYSEAQVSATANNVGGLVGLSVAGITINRSYAVGAVLSTGASVGGLVGTNVGTINNSYFGSTVVGAGNRGGLVGVNTGGTYNNNFWDITIAGAMNSVGDDGNLPGIIADQTASLTQEQTFTDVTWDFAANWTMPQGADGIGTPKLRSLYPCNAVYVAGVYSGTGTIEDPIKICNTAQYNQLVATSADWSKYIRLYDNIDFAGATIGVIGNTTTAFSGTFDGYGHTLSNFVISQPGVNNVGLFGVVNGDGNLDYSSDGVIIHLNVSSANVSGDQNIGIVAGQLQTGKIIYVKVNSGQVSGSTNIGGVVGYSTNSYLALDTTTGAITDQGSLIFRVLSQVDVTSTDQNCGGISGQNAGEIQLSTFAGDLNCISSVGGIAGLNSGNIKNSFNRSASYTGTTNVGSIAGVNSGLVDKVYSGYNSPAPISSNSGTISSCYYDSQVASSTNSLCTGLTTAQAQAQANFTNFSFETNWIENSSYPRLRWE